MGRGKIVIRRISWVNGGMGIVCCRYLHVGVAVVLPRQLYSRWRSSRAAALMRMMPAMWWFPRVECVWSQIPLKMKPGYTSLKKLTDKSKSKGFRLKVKITHKGPATTSPSKRRFQRLVVRDDEGNTMKATLFENDIDIYAEALKRNGEYELTDVAVKPLPPAYRTRTDEEYQLCLGGRMRIRTLNLSDVDEEPKYRLLSYVPPCMRDHEPLIDLAAVVIYVGNMREEMQDDYPKPVREILIADQSVSRPMKLIAKNRFAYDDISPFLKNWHETFQVVGFTGIRLYTYRA